MKEFALAIVVLLGGIACAITKTPHAGPATIPTPPIVDTTPTSTEPPQDAVSTVSVPSQDCVCNVCQCVVCQCEPVHTDALEFTPPTMVAASKPQPVTVGRSTFGPVYSSCGPGGCGQAQPVRRLFFRGRR